MSSSIFLVSVLFLEDIITKIVDKTFKAGAKIVLGLQFLYLQ